VASRLSREAMVAFKDGVTPPGRREAQRAHCKGKNALLLMRIEATICINLNAEAVDSQNARREPIVGTFDEHIGELGDASRMVSNSLSIVTVPKPLEARKSERPRHAVSVH
jgi:hypothetical protein